MKYLEFSNEDKMPAIGLGTWKSEPGDVYNAVLEAIKVGYRHIDCAKAYDNEAEVGQAIEKAIKEGLIKREDLWVTSKLWNNAHLKDDVKPALESTLKDLKLDYLDLYLVHWPVAFDRDVSFPSSADEFKSLNEIPVEETWKGMEEVKDAGLANHIGVSNFSSKKIKDLIDKSRHQPEVNQVELHPYLQQEELFQFCRKNDIHVTGYSPLGSGDRSDSMKNENEPSLLENDIIEELAGKHNCTGAQILIAWHVNRGTSTIPKSTNPDRIKQNFQSKDIKLSADDMDQIKSLDKGYRYIDGSFWVQEENSYTLENIWDE